MFNKDVTKKKNNFFKTFTLFIIKINHKLNLKKIKVMFGIFMELFMYFYIYLFLQLLFYFIWNYLKTKIKYL